MEEENKRPLQPFDTFLKKAGTGIEYNKDRIKVKTDRLIERSKDIQAGQKNMETPATKTNI